MKLRRASLVVSLPAQVEAAENYIFRFVSEIDRRSLLSGSQQQARACQQAQTEGDLRHREHIAQARSWEPAPEADAFFLQRRRKAGAGKFQGGRKTENDSSQQREQQRVSEHAQVRAEIEVHQRNVRRKKRSPHRPGELAGPVAEQKPERSAEQSDE